MNFKYLLIAFLFISSAVGLEAQSVTINDDVGCIANKTLIFSGTHNGKNYYSDAGSGISLYWDSGDSRWEVDGSNSAPGTNTSIIWVNSTDSAPNPPDLTLGTWVDVSDITFGTPGTTYCGTLTQMDGSGTQSSVGACTEPDVPSSLNSSPGTICDGNSATLTWLGNLNDATSWHIYSGSCGGTLETTTTSNSAVVTPPSAGETYFVRGEGACASAGSCTSRFISVTPIDDASFSYATATYCVDDADPTPTVTGLAGGTFSSTAGLNINASTGTVDVSASTPGTYTVTYTTTGTCSNSSTAFLSVNALPVVTFTAPDDVALNAGVQAGLSGGNPGAGATVIVLNYDNVTFSDGGAPLGTLTFDDPLTASSTATSFSITTSGGNEAIFPPFTYTENNSTTMLTGAPNIIIITTTDGSNREFALQFTSPMTTNGVKTIGSSTNYECKDGCGTNSRTPSGTITRTSGPGDSGIYSGPGVTDDGNGMTYSFDPAAAGLGTHTLTYTYTDNNGCTNSASDDIVVNIPVATTLGCNNYIELGVSGTAWIDFLDGSGNIVASINPNGTDLGNVGVEMNDLVAVGQDNEGEYYLPRFFNITSSNFDGVGNAFPSAVSLRLYYKGQELTDYNAATGVAALAIGDLIMSHYSGPDEDCDINNNAAPGATATVTDITPAASAYNGADFYLEFNVPHFSEIGAGGGGLMLPVELISFKGRALGHVNELTWSTASEEAFSHFEIERSADGRDFKTLDKVRGNGNTAELSTYAYTDKNYLNGHNYYRLKMVDLDGSFEYSNTILLNTSVKGNISIFPNPSKNTIRIQFQELLEGNADFTITDMSGKMVMQGNINSDNANIDINSLATGLYILQVNGGNVNGSVKLIKE